jgi:hypothetical protein
MCSPYPPVRPGGSALPGPPASLADVPTLPIEWLVGPVAALALLLVVGRELWKSHQAADQRERDRSDLLEKRLGEVVEILKRARPR